MAKGRVEAESASQVVPFASFKFPALRAARDLEDYLVHVAALEWSLDAPITIRGVEDIQSRREWADRLEPYAHQIQNLVTFCRRAPVTLLADDVGLGKTISAGLILSELMVRRKITRTLVIAPKLLVSQWQEELGVKFGIPATTASGAEFREAIGRRVPAVVTTYDSARRYMDELKHAGFDMLVLDEAHKLRNLHGTKVPPQFAVRIREALADRWFKYVLMLTATPIQNRLWDLYSLIDLLTAAKGHANPLGSPELFKAQYIEDQRAIRIRPGRQTEFRRHLGSYIVRTRRRDAKLLFPERRVKMHRVKASPAESRIMGIIGELFSTMDSWRQKLNGLAQSSIGQALMSSPEALTSQLDTMAERGSIPAEYAARVREAMGGGSLSGKLKGLKQLVSELRESRPNDWRMVVFTSRMATLETIGSALRADGVSVGFIRGSDPTGNQKTVRQFRESPPGVRVVVSTDAGAEGVNLQSANVLVNYDLPWNPMVLEQRIGRVQRLASKHAEVIILNLVLAGSVEERVVARLSEKLQAVSESIGDVEAILETVSGPGSEDDPIESIIRKLVINSLKGLDQEEATRRAVESIEEARRIFTEEQETVEKTLGDLRNLHRAGPTVPEITPVEPSLEARDFVLRSLRADGATLAEDEHKDCMRVHLPGQTPFLLTFTERRWDEQEEFNVGHFGSVAPRAYLPGKRDFERLSQSWSDKAHALLVERSAPDDRAIEAGIADAIGQIDGASLDGFEIIESSPLISGEFLCRASISNGVDRLEKLVSTPLDLTDGVDLDPPAEGEPLSRRSVSQGDLRINLAPLVAPAIAAEEDLGKFRRFYEERLQEEITKADDAAAARRLREQFSPAVAAEVVGLRGVRSARIVVSANVAIDGHGPFPVRVTLIPQAGRIDVTMSEELEACGPEGRMLPSAALGTCEISGARVPAWDLGTCAVTGKRAVLTELVRCEDTGDLVLSGETDLCSVSGRRVRRSLLVTSPASGRPVLPDRCKICSFTGSAVSPDDLKTSEISGQPFRVDEEAQSVVTGRRGHVSEFVQSIDPPGLLERSLAGQSDVSGAWALADRLVESALNPGRKALASEVGRCPATGAVLLPDEGISSTVSGVRVTPGVVIRCSFSGASCLPSEAATSEVSGRPYRLDQQGSSVLSGRKGHASEFVRSSDPPGWLAVDEAERSDISGAVGARDRLVPSSRSPHRRGLRHEVVRCEISGSSLLRDEVGFCSVTGKTVDHNLLSTSPVSGREALDSEMVVCELTGAKLCPDEVARCEVSGKLVDQRELAPSAESGRLALRRVMLTCAASGKLMLPSEALRCDVTGRMIAASEAARCRVTGRQAMRSRLTEAPSSDELFIDDPVTREEVRRSTGLDEIIVSCQWTGAKHLAIHTSRCRLTGLRIGPDVANSSGELACQRHQLDGSFDAGTEQIPEAIIRALRRSTLGLKHAKSGLSCWAPRRRLQVACIELRSGLFGGTHEYASVVMSSSNELLGEPIVGTRNNGRWTAG